MVENNDFIFNTGAYISKGVTLRFADGEHAVPGWIVSHSGGEQLLRDNAGALAQITYADFIKAFNDETVSAGLRGVQDQILRDHFRRIR